ncbi:MAG: hypothetical protein EHM61_19945 [Acidobacteria bacterium]|nr:MAG: hypothetical protein EHM61_19945 [Acidobacteriota bacterium]
MKIKTTLLSVVACAALLAAAAAPVEQKETIRKQFSPVNGGAPMSLVIDNMWGAITVNVHQRPDVEVVIDKKLEAPSEAAAQRFTEKVKLDISQTGNDVRLYVDGPFRERNRGFRNRDWDFEDSRLVCDYQVLIPANARIELKTVLDGDIKVTGAAGEFDIDVVIGSADLRSMSGFGRVSAINGGVTAVFDRNPVSPCYFKTINGDVRVSFPESLSAELHFKTFHGDVFTDFPVTTLPPLPTKRESQNGKSIYRVSEFFRVRVGKGGPELKFDTLNGDIEVHDRAL